ncbi:MAG TPA: aminomethyltransferase beta-barrel domain-containing protein, partial [Nannocystaceae bacterium]|nr:aminomethyltransferase beta-barrel domain-containing protein [Nannocystaceae bacterium]
DHGAVVEERLRRLGLPTTALAPGPVVDEAGVALGEHEGIHRVTVGQRRGLRVPGLERRYVLAVVPSTRTVVVGPAEHATRTRLQVGELQRLALADGRRRALVQVRHRSAPVAATIDVDGDVAAVELDAAVAGVAPGQAAVFYDADRVLGGGWIDAAT